jgi:hypothetical protein
MIPRSRDQRRARTAEEILQRRAASSSDKLGAYVAMSRRIAALTRTVGLTQALHAAAATGCDAASALIEDLALQAHEAGLLGGLRRPSAEDLLSAVRDSGQVAYMRLTREIEAALAHHQHAARRAVKQEAGHDA